MQASVVTFEKPIQHIGLADWHAKQWQNQQTNDTRRNDAFNLRHEARQLRNETRIRTEWDTYHNNARLADRITEVDRWRATLKDCLDRVDHEMELLKDEKLSTEREFEALGIPLGVVSECISMRDCRLGVELTYDDGDTELKKVFDYELLRDMQFFKYLFSGIMHNRKRQKDANRTMSSDMGED